MDEFFEYSWLLIVEYCSGLWLVLFKIFNFILILFSSIIRGWDVIYFELWGDNFVFKGRN